MTGTRFAGSTFHSLRADGCACGSDECVGRRKRRAKRRETEDVEKKEADNGGRNAVQSVAKIRRHGHAMNSAEQPHPQKH